MKKKIILTLIILSIFAFVLSGCNEQEIFFEIEVMSSNIQHGRVFGDGNYKINSQVTLSAVEEENSSFVAWIKNNVQVSQEKTFTFLATSETEGQYTAVFANEIATYYNAYSLKLDYKHILEIENLVDISGVNLQLTQINSLNPQTVYNNGELDIEVNTTYESTNELSTSTNYFLSKQKIYYLDAQISYSVNGNNSVLSKTVIIDFSQMTSVLNEDTQTSFYETTLTINNATLNTVLTISFYPALSQITQEIE